MASKESDDEGATNRTAAGHDSDSERHKLLFNTMVQGVVYQDSDGKMIMANPAAQEILGRTSEELLGHNTAEEKGNTIRSDGTPFPGSEHPAMVALRTGKAVHDVTMGVFNPRERRHRWINISAIPLFERESKKPYQVYSIFEDITEKRQFEKELKASELRYRSVIQAAPWGMHLYELKHDGRLVFVGWNPEADRILGISHESLIGLTMEEAFPANVGTELHEAYRKVAITGEPWHSELVNYSDDRIKGAFEVFAFQNSPMHMVATFMDITRRVDTERGTRDLLEQVQEEKDRLNALVSSMTDEVWFAGKDKKFRLANPSAVREFDLDSTTREIDVESFASSLEVFRGDGSPRPPEEAPPLRALSGETVRNEEEIVRVPSSGQLKYRLVTSTPVKDESGAIIGSVSVVRDVTEKKMAERDLRSTSEYLEKLFAYANAPIIVWDTSFRITRFNRAFERMTGYTSKEVLKRDLSILFPENSKDESLDLIARTLSGEQWESVEIPILRKDGSIRIALWNSANIYDKDGKTLAATIAQGQDITERKKAQAALHEYMATLERSNEELGIAKGRLEALISSMPVGVLITDTAGKFLVVNESLRHIWGGNIPLPQDFTGFNEFKAWFADSGKTVAPEDWPISKAMTNGTGVSGHVFDIQRFDGTRGTIIASAVPLCDASGRVVAGAAFAQDVSDLKRIERVVRDERNKLQFVLDSLPVAVGLYDINGRRIMANSQVDSIWRGSLGQIQSTEDFGRYIGYNSKTGFRLKPAEWPISRVLATEEPVHNQEIDIVRLDRSPATILASAVPTKDETGKTTGALIAYVDISGQKAIEKELARSNTELQSFAYAASHDLREPLRTISGFLEILSMDYGDKLDHEAKEHIRKAVNASTRLHVMIDDLLSFSRLETRKKPFRRVNLEETLANVLAELNKTLTEHKASVIADPLPTVWADEQQMAIVFRNLIDNGVKFHRMEPPKIRITAKKSGDEWVLRFEDNGIGIDERYFARVFDMFVRLHSRVEYPGTGIGLAMCKKIIERHGGQIWVESEVGKGAAFIFTIHELAQKSRRSADIETWAGERTASTPESTTSPDMTDDHPT